MDSANPRPAVLVVDDEEDVREAICDLLSLCGYATVGAIDGVMALRLLREQPFDLVITDLQMPAMDGWELLSVMRADPQLRRIPVCVVSSAADPPPTAARLIRKPFDLSVLREAVARLLGRTFPRTCAA